MASKTVAQWDQDSFAWYQDTGGEGTNQIGSTNSNPSTLVSGTQYRLRYLIQETNASNQSETPSFELEYRVDPAGGTNFGSWLPVDSDDTYFTAVSSANVTDGASTSQQIGGGTFRDGEFSYVDATAWAPTNALTATQGNDEYECEWVLLFTSSGGNYEFRVTLDGGNTMDSTTNTTQVLVGGLVTYTRTTGADSYLRQEDNTETVGADAWIGVANNTVSTDADSYLRNENNTISTDADAYLRQVGNTESTEADSFLKAQGQTQTTGANGYLKALAQTLTASADAHLSGGAASAGTIVVPDSRMEVPELYLPGRAPLRRCRLDRSNPLAADQFYLFGPNHGQDLGSAGLHITIPNTGTHTLEGWNNEGATADCGSCGPMDLTKGAIIFHLKPSGNWNDINHNTIVASFSGGNFYLRWILADGGNFQCSWRGGYGNTIVLNYDPVGADNTEFHKERILGFRWQYDIGCDWWESGVKYTSDSTTTGTGALANVTDPDIFNNNASLFRSFQRFVRRPSDYEMSRLTLDPYLALVPE